MRRRIVIERAERLHQIPPYPAQELSRYKKRLEARDIRPIDLTVGVVEAPANDAVVERIGASIQTIGRHPDRMPAISSAFCEAFAAWFAQRFDIDLDPATQVLPLLSTKTGVSCLPLALVNPGESVLVPDPAYPAYRTSTIMAGGQVHPLPLLERNDYLPNFRQVDPAVAYQTKLMFLSYPNNPTGAVADLTFFREVVDFARKYNIIVCHDATHYFLTYDDYETPSFLQAGGGDVGIEMFSLSVLLGGSPWELGVAVGNAPTLAALSQLTHHLEPPLFRALQEAAIDALRTAEAQTQATVVKYRQRRDVLIDGLQKLGWKIRKPKGGVYAWMGIPPRYSSVRFSVLLRKAGVFAVPGSYMGEYGEGYIRVSLHASEEELRTVVQRVEQGASRLRLRRLALSHPA
jgi:LL-diaminopimelate aminotransferase